MRIRCDKCKEISEREKVTRQTVENYGTYCDHCNLFITFWRRENNNCYIFKPQMASGVNKDPKEMSPF